MTSNYNIDEGRKNLNEQVGINKYVNENKNIEAEAAAAYNHVRVYASAFPMALP